MSNDIDWTLVTVTYNSERHLQRHWSTINLVGVRWVVIDNGSSDGSGALASSLGADVIELGRNLGFGAANNIGMRYSRSEYIAFVNPDVSVKTGDLSRLATTCAATGGLVAPQLLNSDGSAQSNGRGIPFLFDKLAHRHIHLPGARLDLYARAFSATTSPTFVTWAIGAAVCGLRSSFVGLGGWDERYFLYYEDHELGLRAWQDGLSVAIDPTVRWIHDWQRDTTRFRLAPWRREIASGLRFYTRHGALVLPRRRHVARIHPELAKSLAESV